MDITFFESEQAFDAERAKDPSHCFYALEFNKKDGLLPEIVYLSTSEKTWGFILDDKTGKQYQIANTKEEALRALSVDISSPVPTADATDTTSTPAPSNAVDTTTENALPITHNLEEVCEFFVSEEEFIEATVKACTNDGFFYAHRCVKIEKAVTFCDKVEYLHIKVSEHEAFSSKILFNGNNRELFFSHESVGLYILFHHKKDAQSYLDKRAQDYPATVVSESEFLALCPQIKAVSEDPKRSTEAIASMVKPVTLEEKRAEIAQRQPEQRSRYTSWLLTPPEIVRGFEEGARQKALITSGVYLPSPLVCDGVWHDKLLTEHDKSKGRSEGDYSCHGSYIYTREADGFLRIGWNSWNGDGGCYTIAQYMKEVPSQELTDNQRRAIQERAEKRRIAYERKARIIEEQAKKYRAEWMQRYNTADGSIQDCLYLKKKGFNLADVESVLEKAGVKYDRDGTLRIPYKHSSPQYNNTYAGHQAINPSHEIDKSFGKGADCGRDGNFIWTMLASDTGSPVTFLCEGIATSLSVSLATRANVINCFNAGGLVKVSRGIKDKKFPIPLDLSQVFICADNDIKEGSTGNTGLEAAIKASQILGCSYFLPESGGRKCDFDDLRTWHGIEEVRAQLQEERAITPHVENIDGRNVKTGQPVETNRKCSISTEGGDGTNQPEESVDIDISDCEIPFPLETLPPEVQDFLLGCKQATGRKESLFAAGFLEAISTAIGTKVRLRVKGEDWTPYAHLSIVLVADSSAGKTLVNKYVFSGFEAKQDIYHDEYLKAKKQYEDDLLDYERDRKIYVNSKDENLERPQKPDVPFERRCITKSFTIEKLVSDLQHNPNGLLVLTSELSAIMGSMGKYSQQKNARGDDQSIFMDAMDGNRIDLGRMGREGEVIPAKYSFLNFFSATQKKIVPSQFTAQDIFNGFFPRFSFVTFNDDLFISERDQRPLTQRMKDTRDQIISFMCDLLRDEIRNEDGTSTYEPRELFLQGKAWEVWWRVCDSLRIQALAYSAKKETEKKSIVEKSKDLFHSLLIILHAVESFFEDPYAQKLPTVIKEGTAKRAAKLTDWFVKNKLQVFEIWKTGHRKLFPENTQSFLPTAVYTALAKAILALMDTASYGTDSKGNTFLIFPTSDILNYLKANDMEAVTLGLKGSRDILNCGTEEHHLHLARSGKTIRVTDPDGKKSVKRGLMLYADNLETLDYWANYENETNSTPDKYESLLAIANEPISPTEPTSPTANEPITSEVF